MKWFIFSDEVAWSGSSFKKGVEAIGHEVVLRNPMAWTDDSFRLCDIAVVFGLRQAQRDCLHSYTRRGIKTVVVDLGYVDRFEDHPNTDDPYLQISIGDTLNIIPKGPCPRDRFDKLNLRYPGKKNVPSGYALFCGQLPGDAAHPFHDELSVKEFLREIRERIPSVDVRYRAHPKLVKNKIDRKALEEDFAGARCVLTWNSNSGHDALREGLPVFCHEDAAYASLGSNIVDVAKRIKRPPFPSEERWTDYFCRLAYGQWSFGEIASGEVQKYILSQISE